MTAVRPLTLELRYAVYAKYRRYFTDGVDTEPQLINSYTRPEVAKRAVLALMSGPQFFVEDAWFVDTTYGDRQK